MKSTSVCFSLTVPSKKAWITAITVSNPPSTTKASEPMNSETTGMYIK